jgi:hypothetical protein
MKIKKTLMFSMFCSALLSSAVHAANDNGVSIDVMSDARVFAQYDEEIPAVINYYTKKSEQNVIDFYRGKYGSPSFSQRLKGRLTQKFMHDGKHFRVVISQQDNYRQVDVIVTK